LRRELASGNRKCEIRREGAVRDSTEVRRKKGKRTETSRQKSAAAWERKPREITLRYSKVIQRATLDEVRRLTIKTKI